MAAIAASLICRGVGKWGSPAPKSTRFAPWARSLAASAATAMVAETSIRPIRSAKTWEGVETVIALLSLQISSHVQNAVQEKPGSGPQEFSLDQQHGIICCHGEQLRSS